MKVDDLTWEAAYALLQGHQASAETGALCAAITRLGKPLDPGLVMKGAPVVAEYLSHEDSVVRERAFWFLGCWGKIPSYLPSLIEAARSDEDVDNRAFAARCAGQILKSRHDRNAIRALLGIANNQADEPEARLAAYSALLYAFHGEAGKQQAQEFEPMGDKDLADFDLPWLSSLPGWIENLPA